MTISSYQRRKNEVEELRRENERLSRRASFFMKAIWNAREATGERMGISPFGGMEGNEEHVDMSFNPEQFADEMLQIIRGLPIETHDAK
jgi:hypothetical protein